MKHGDKTGDRVVDLRLEKLRRQLQASAERVVDRMMGQMEAAPARDTPATGAPSAGAGFGLARLYGPFR